MEIWPKGKAPSVVAPRFIRRRPDLTFCEGLRNNITLDFRARRARALADAYLETRLFSLHARWNAWDLLGVPGDRANPNAGMAEI